MPKAFFERERIPFYRELSVGELAVWDKEKFSRLWDRIGGIESAIVFLIPYYSGQRTTNLSVYAQPRDYHWYVKELSERFEAYLRSRGFEGKAVCMADTSPIDERRAALSAGLGFLGKNGLVINEKYGSYFFIGTVFLSRAISPQRACPARACPSCGACLSACPTGAVTDPNRRLCLSYLSQKKNRTAEEEALVAGATCKWGCDLCQTACPFNRNPKHTEIPFFLEDHVSRLTPDIIESPKSEFLKRAFSWRGREILRNNIKSEKNDEKD